MKPKPICLEYDGIRRLPLSLRIRNLQRLSKEEGPRRTIRKAEIEALLNALLPKQLKRETPRKRQS